MTQKLRSIPSRLAPAVLIGALLLIWQLCSDLRVVPKFMLPSPTDVLSAFVSDFPALLLHARVSLSEAFLGLSTAMILSFAVAYLMDRFRFVRDSVYPLLILTQTIPTVAIAPLLVLWLGYGILLSGFASADGDLINLMRAMGATKGQIFRYVKLPSSAEQFFSGLRISASYSVVGAVIAEWLGGFEGLGVYMMRVKKSYSFDKMFAVILLISIISLLLIKAVDLIKKRSMPWVELHPADN